MKHCAEYSTIQSKEVMAMSSSISLKEVAGPLPPSAGQNRIVVVLPGILARGEEQIEPVSEALALVGAVYTASYCDKWWDSEEIVADLTSQIVDLTDQNPESRFILVGISIGGLLLPELVEWLQMREVTVEQSIVIDAPYGADTLLPLPKASRSFFVNGGYRRWAGPVGNLLLRGITRPPKTRDITVPEGLTPVEAKQYCALIKRCAREYLSGHSWSIWGSQLAWMASPEGQVDLTPLVNQKVTYMACVSLRNDTVDQPLASERWAGKLLNAKIIEVDTAHAGFLVSPLVWNRAIEQLWEE